MKTVDTCSWTSDTYISVRIVFIHSFIFL